MRSYKLRIKAILSLLAISIIFASCTMPRSPRNQSNGYKKSINESTKASENKNNDKQILEQISEFEKLIEENNRLDGKINDRFVDDPIVEPNSENQNTNFNFFDKTLNQRIKTIEENQSNYKANLSKVQIELNNIRERLALIESKNSISVPVAGGQTNFEEISSSDIANSSILESDEVTKPSNSIIANTKSSNDFKNYNDKKKKNKSFTIKSAKSNDNTKSKSNSRTQKKLTISSESHSESIDSQNGLIASSNTENTEEVANFLNEINKKILAKDYHDAIHMLQERLENERNPDQQNICYYYLGESNLGLRNYNEALNHFKKVINSRHSSRKEDSIIKAAEALSRLGKADEARSMYQRLVDNFPSSVNTPKARKMLQQL